jgi:hypothetical protein
MQAFLWGVLAACCGAAALFFARYWSQTRDRLLLWFALAFAALAVHWTALGVLNIDAETRPFIYLIRLAAFVLIIGGIVAKNRERR